MINWKWAAIGALAVCLGPLGIPFMLGVLAVELGRQRDERPRRRRRETAPTPEEPTTVTTDAVVTPYGVTRW